MRRAREAQIANGIPPAWSTVATDRVETDIAQECAYVMRNGGVVIGALAIRTDDVEVWGDQPPDALYIHRLAIEPTMQRCGLGSRAIAWAEQRALSDERTMLRLDAVAENTVLASWYQRLGFEPRGAVQPPCYRRLSMRYEKRLALTSAEC